ncbi:hypothetical protein SKDZ_07G2880 [Saccharomyces kudriavzevii ZP591]|nr:hypothetical protein SKDZ_07G2880 [Saccharomyces kudriavzevii ZP591]
MLNPCFSLKLFHTIYCVRKLCCYPRKRVFVPPQDFLLEKKKFTRGALLKSGRQFSHSAEQSSPRQQAVLSPQTIELLHLQFSHCNLSSCNVTALSDYCHYTH